MSDPVRWSGQAPPMRSQQSQPAQSSSDGTNLADILERVLDKGIVIAGDIQINLLDIELLTIKIRLVVASVDKAKEMGIDWWERDPTLSSGHRELEDENRRLRERLESLEGGQEALADVEDTQLEEAPRDEPDPEDIEDAELEDDADDGPGDEPEPAEARPRRRTSSGSGSGAGSGSSSGSRSASSSGSRSRSANGGRSRARGTST